MANETNPGQAAEDQGGRSKDGRNPGVARDYSTGTGSVGDDPGILLAADNNTFVSAVSDSIQNEPHPPRRRTTAALLAQVNGPQGSGRIVSRNAKPSGEVHGPTYDMVMDERSQYQPPHFMGTLLPSAYPRRDNRLEDFYTGMMRDDDSDDYDDQDRY